ncbi:hypothetical protein Tco_1480599 [Tanacetum coccineum]
MDNIYKHLLAVVFQHSDPSNYGLAPYDLHALHDQIFLTTLFNAKSSTSVAGSNDVAVDFLGNAYVTFCSTVIIILYCQLHGQNHRQMKKLKVYSQAMAEVRDDLTLLGDLCLEMSDMLHVISGLNERYHFLHPLTCHELLIKQYTTWERDSARKELKNPRSGMDSESITSDDYLWD